ncbi:MAG: hypothetical protein SCH71_14335 [Desulfobulbaceae bacterium]|nr:hypothetical protein [Desulfobulbaceae bacterium]
MKTVKKIEAGSEIDSRCLKCKDVTNHTVIAMADGKVAKVQCNVCGGRHKYRPVKPEKKGAAKKKATRSTTGIKQARAEAYYDEMIAGRDPSEAMAYSMTEIFKKGDLIVHPTFGIGLVIETEMPDKIEVLFRQESKFLICGPLSFKC